MNKCNCGVSNGVYGLGFVGFLDRRARRGKGHCLASLFGL